MEPTGTTRELRQRSFLSRRIERAGATSFRLHCEELTGQTDDPAGSQVLEEFKAFGLNPLSPLRHAPFLPDFATGSDTPEARLYVDVLGRVERAWGVAALGNIGGAE